MTTAFVPPMPQDPSQPGVCTGGPAGVSDRRGSHPTYGLLLHVGNHPLLTQYGDFDVHVFQNLYTRTYALAVCRGPLRGPEPVLTRVHSSCITSEAFDGCDCDCAQQLEEALERLRQADRGILFYLMQEGRGAGYAAKAHDRMIVQASRDQMTTFEAYEQLGLSADHRRYDEVALALRILGITAPLRLLTNNPSKLRELREQGVAVLGTETVQHPATPFNVHYLAAKRTAGHELAHDALVQRAVELPEPVRAFTPCPLADAPHLIRMASYLLPIRAPSGTGSAPVWFRAHVYFDLLARCERVVLTYAQDRIRPANPPCVRIQRESLFERFPIRNGINKRQWRATVAEFIRCGQGVAVFPSADGHDEEFAATVLQRTPPSDPARAARLTDEAIFLLVKHHVPTGVVTPLFTSLDEPSARQAVLAQFAQHRFQLNPATVLELADL